MDPAFFNMPASSFILVFGTPLVIILLLIVWALTFKTQETGEDGE